MYLSHIAHSPFVCLAVALVGLVAGSFVNCWAYRRIHGGSILAGRSCCPACGHVLGPSELVPVVSWLVQRGRCRHCGTPIGVRYPASEVVCAVAMLGVLLRPVAPASDALWLLETIELCLFSCILLYVSLTDFDAMLIPNGAVLAALAVRAAFLAGAFALGEPDAAAMLVESLVGGLVLGGGLLALVLVADRVLGRDSMGGGDIKLMFVAGCYFGWQQGLACLLVACVVGIVGMVLAQVLVRPGDDAGDAAGNTEGARAEGPADDAQEDSFMRKTMPFGPAIALACWVTIVWGPGMMGAYLALFQ